MLRGSGAIAQGPGAVAVGARGAAVGGSVEGSVIVTNNRSTVESARRGDKR
jgi:hypothetical protein